MPPRDRSSEWFVPAFGPPRFRLYVGLLFLPYTGMVLSYVVIGSMLAETVHWDRVGAILVIYFVALGIGAHALDAIGGDGLKPWGEAFSRTQLWTLAAVAVVTAYAIAIYFAVYYVPLLWLIAIPEGFFLFAYNLEWFRGRFHTDGWFAVSWGVLPVLAGYVIQTNSVSLAALVVAAGAGCLSLVEIKASRPYKDMKRSGMDRNTPQVRTLEAILKSVSAGVILLGIGLALWRAVG
ncbi:MAG TPA: hypothetical protein VFY80_06990 [Burkholderiales bacterium]|nr:hypothetical protein [Burkholderiales bacterium]